MRTLKTLSIVMALVAIMSTVSLANTDSLQVTDSLGNNTYVLVNQDVVDSLTDAGNLNAAVAVQTAMNLLQQKAERDQFVADSLAEEANKQFQAEIDSVRNEIPKDLDSIVTWIDSPAKGFVAMQHFGVPKKGFDQNASVDDFKSMVQDAAMIMSMIKRHTVELNGPAHRTLKQQDSLLIDYAIQTADSLQVIKEQIEMINSNIATLRDQVDQNAINAMAALQCVDFAKIHGQAKKDARELRQKLTAQVERDYQPIELCIDEDGK